MTSLPDAIKQVCSETHLPIVAAAFGNSGVDAIFRIMETVKTLYKHVEPERIRGHVIVFQLVWPRDTTPEPPRAGPPADFGAIANRAVTDLIFEIASDGLVYARMWPDVSLEDLAKNAVVYHWQSGQEEFLAGDGRKPVLRLDSAARSQFAVPTFSSLREALLHYARENVRESTCYIFQQVWRGENRLFLKAKAEVVMRNSLTQFLRNRMGADHDVWPEQIVDESHPVDIRVKPRLTNNRLMLIEIKWLGWSVAEDGHVTARHKNPRAQEGADQLAQYLDDQRRFAPSYVIQGYYVIIDGRRENLQEGATTISRADGMHYEDKELTFAPSHHEVRPDFDPPYRMFASPVCTD
jgi:hypothetical protein